MEKADLDVVNKAIADALKPVTDQLKPLADGLKSVSDNQKVIADTMAADKTKADKAAADAEKAKKDADAKAAADKGVQGDAAKPLTAEEIDKRIADGVAAKFADQQKAQQSSAERNAFIGDKLKDVPAAYQAKLGTDPAKWEEQATAIRTELKADLVKIPGVSVKDVAAGTAGGSTASSATAEEKITQFKATGLSDGQANFASTLVMPK